ncbi:MAG: MipA/OmpV family protein [Alphaproteobacteria bacterium]|nr:MipA/OmpV family protein [Alphaproteobacteria bacterium]
MHLYRILALTTVAWVFCAPSSFADPTTAMVDTASADAETPATKKKVWDVILGVGAAIRPAYEGSDHYTVSPVPFVKVTYDDMVSLGMRGLDAYWHHDNFRIGTGLTYSGGRKDSRTNGVFSDGDNRLKGLGTVDRALGVKGFASYNSGPMDFGGSVTKFTGGNNDGVLVNVGVSHRFKITEQFSVSPHVGTTWGDHSYMQTFFGVTQTQAANTVFPQFSAGAGFKDVSASLNTNYRFNEHWFVDANAGAVELIGDASKSPICLSSLGARFLTMIGYRF